MYQQPGFTAHASTSLRSREEMKADIEGRLAADLPAGMGNWVWQDRLTGEVVGRGALFSSPWTPDDRIETGWFLHPKRWGRGLATEAARAQIVHAFQTLGLREVWAFVRTDNAASAALAKRLGFILHGTEKLFDRAYFSYRLENA